MTQKHKYLLRYLKEHDELYFFIRRLNTVYFGDYNGKHPINRIFEDYGPTVIISWFCGSSFRDNIATKREEMLEFVNKIKVNK